MNLLPRDLLLTEPRPRLSLRDWVIAMVVFAMAFGLYTRNNDFPAHYHPDEPSKVRQLREQDFNFNHPLLLLQTTRVFLGFESQQKSQMEIVRAGRTASAFFTAAASALLVLVAAHMAGPLAAALAGLLLLSNHQLYELAHYMKEDPALALGMCAAVFGFVRSGLNPRLSNFALLGLGCALAVSGKYVGVLSFAFPVALAVFCGEFRKARGLSAFFLAFFAGVLAVNFPMLLSIGELTENVGREMNYAVGGHKGLTRSVPHGVYGAVFRESTNPVIWILVGAFYAGLLACWIPQAARFVRKSGPWWLSWVLGFFPLAYAVVLSFSPKTHHRYFLPATCLILLLCALAPFRFASRQVVLALIALALVAVGLAGFKTWNYDQAFARDTRRQLLEFVVANLPADAGIAQDKRVGLPVVGQDRFEDSGMELPQKVHGKLFAADVAPLSELRAMGIEYVAVSKGDYGRFFLKTHKAREDAEEDYLRRKAFYEELFETGTLLWEAKSGQLQYLQPDIRLYKLPPP